MLFTENHRHSSVDPGNELVGVTGYDRAGVQPLPSRGIFPTFPEPGKDEWRRILPPTTFFHS
jgi:hypothetical protein